MATNEKNEAFIARHEELRAQGMDNKAIRGQIMREYDIARHPYRAWLSRLANPAKYGGVYAARAREFMLREGKTTGVVKVTAGEPLVEANF